MKMQIMRLKRQRGFTLVECIIAIAVFGVLCLAVLMILTNAQTLAHNATESEESLTSLIDNVVGDNTHRKFNDESDYLELKLSDGNTFTISYDTISGYKDYVQCPNDHNEYGDPTPCGYMATNTEFMLKTDGSRMKPEEFDPSYQYTCPKCGHKFPTVLTCEECGNEGAMTDTANFHYVSENEGKYFLDEIGSFHCEKCDGTSVKVKGINEAITSDSNFSLGGMIPNGIRYGEVKFKADDEKESLISITDASGNTATGGSLTMTLEYVAQESHAVSGYFKLRLNGTGLPSGYKINIKTPQYYNISDYESLYNSYDVNVNNKPSNPEEERLMTIKEISGSGTSINTEIRFKCLNYKSGYSIQYDYNRKDDDDAQGLFQWFFDENANLQNVTRDKNNLYLTSAKKDRTISF